MLFSANYAWVAWLLFAFALFSPLKQSLRSNFIIKLHLSLWLSVGEVLIRLIVFSGCVWHFLRKIEQQFVFHGPRRRIKCNSCSPIKDSKRIPVRFSGFQFVRILRFCNQLL